VDLAAVFLKPAFNSEEWTVVVSKHRSDALAVAKRFTRLLLLSIALIALAAGLFAHVQVRRNIAPLGVLEEGTRRISEGDFQSRVEIRSGDEFEDLARSFNTMADRLGKEFRVQAEMGRIVQMILGETAREKIVETLLGNVDSVVPCDGSGLFLFDGKAKEDGTIAFLREAGSAAASQKSGTGLLLSGEAIRRLTSVETSMVVEARGEFGDFLSPWTEPRPSAFLLAPVVSGGELQGALLLGYREFPDASRETLIRLRQIADQAAIALNRARLLEELTENDLGTLQALARTVDTNSPWTAGHSQRVTALAMDIGRKMGLQQQELDLLHRGGLLHDLGKIGISPSILEKPGKLTEEEFAVMRRHPSAGASILGPIPNLQKVIPIVSQHHERFDGKGYPNGLSGEAISLHARILALADVWDALSSVRPYRPGWPRKAVIAHLRENAGLHFDPAVVEVFLDIEAQWYAAAAAESSGDPAADPPAVLHRQDARRTAPSMQTAACGTAECPVSGYSEPFLRG
jgi:putative nucleotidyltransferase with HDIG domain